MCLYLQKSYGHVVSYKKSSPFWQKLQKDGKVICYKVYNKDGGGNSSDHRHLTSKYQGMWITGPGPIKSDRKNNKITKKEKNYGDVDKGIHVYITEAMAKGEFGVIVPVVCRKEHFVAMSGDDYFDEAVFTEVEITQKTWDTIVK